MIKWIKQKANVILGISMIAVLLLTLAIQFSGGNQMVLRLGNEAQAAGTLDAVMDGTDDNVQATTLLNALPVTGGRIVIVSGVQVNFAAATSVTRAIPNVMIEGTGAGTYIVGDGATSPFTAGGNGWVLNHLRVNVSTATLLAAMGATTGWSWEDVTTTDAHYVYRTPDTIQVGSVTATTMTATTAITTTTNVSTTLNLLSGYTTFYDNAGRKIQIINPYQAKTNQYRGQLHTHTNVSDGADTPAALVTAYKADGSKFVFLTDHNGITPDPVVAGILVIPGDEVSPGFPGSAHILQLNATIHAPSILNQAIINEINSDNAVAIIAHPFSSTSGYIQWPAPSPDQFSLLNNYAGIEIYNAVVGDTPINFVETFWDNALYNTGRLIWGTGDDDTHGLGLGVNFYEVVVNADSLTRDNIVNAIKSGNFYFRQGGGTSITAFTVSGNTLTVTAGASSNITFIGNNGQILSTTPASATATYTIQGWERYVRVRILTGGKYTWSQPILVNNMVDNGNAAITQIMQFTPSERMQGTSRVYSSNGGWSATSVNGTAPAVGSTPDRIEVFTATAGSNATAGSTAFARTSLTIGKYGSDPTTITWDREAKIEFEYSRSLEQTDPNITARYQITARTTEGELASDGVGVNWVGPTLTFSSYGTGGLGYITTANLTASAQYSVRIHFMPGQYMAWYVNAGSGYRLMALQLDTTKIPSVGTGVHRMIVSITTTASNSPSSCLRIFSPYVWYAQN